MCDLDSSKGNPRPWIRNDHPVMQSNCSRRWVIARLLDVVSRKQKYKEPLTQVEEGKRKRETSWKWPPLQVNLCTAYHGANVERVGQNFPLYHS